MPTHSVDLYRGARTSSSSFPGLNTSPSHSGNVTYHTIPYLTITSIHSAPRHYTHALPITPHPSAVQPFCLPGVPPPMTPHTRHPFCQPRAHNTTAVPSPCSHTTPVQHQLDTSTPTRFRERGARRPSTLHLGKMRWHRPVTRRRACNCLTPYEALLISCCLLRLEIGCGCQSSR